MPEPIDVYSDQFQVTTGPFGCTLNFLLSSPTPPAPGGLPPQERLASVRMSLEHLKVMAFMLRRQVVAHERESRVRIDLPAEVLNALRIGREDWDSFWEH